MQVTLNQNELRLAVKAYLDKIMSVPLSVVDLDIKGMRTSEGYTAAVDVIIDGQEYITVPAQPMVEVAELDNTPMKRHFDGLPELTSEESSELVEILQLVANNPRGVNDKEIYSRGAATSTNLWQHLRKNELFMNVYERVPNVSVSVPNDTTIKAIEEVEAMISNNSNEASETNTDIAVNQDTETSDVKAVTTEVEVFKVQTGVNLLGEPIIEELTQEQIDERILKSLQAKKIEPNTVEQQPLKAGMFS